MMRAIESMFLGLFVVAFLLLSEGASAWADDKVCSARHDLAANCMVIFGRLDCRDLAKIAIIDAEKDNKQKYVVDSRDAQFESEQKFIAELKVRCEAGALTDGTFQVCPLLKNNLVRLETPVCLDRAVFTGDCQQTAMTQAA